MREIWRNVRRWLGALLAAAAVCLPSTATFATETGARVLRVFFIDVEGGQATLFVEPSGESLLIDTGWPDHGGRDADRILSAAKGAGLKKIDYVLITHFHPDHVGGVPALLERIPVGTFIDHGPNRETGNAATEQGWGAYRKVLATTGAKRIVPKPGDTLPFKDMKATVLSADGETLARPLPDAGAKNGFCAASRPRPADQTENARSLGVLLAYGPVKILDLGDLTWDKEMQLMCPVNRVGHVPVLIVSHHGWNQSSSPALVDAIRPQIAIMDNGETKGGSTPVLDTVTHASGIKQLWQLHYSAEGGEAHNVPAAYIANLEGQDEGHSLELTVSGRSLSVLNGRTGKTEEYTAR